eukprot:CAMPEP_0204326250 /NCGR_PEP_ID=MMETSP0469-20131031/11669_1 /ASSEMBLY_ACC=CAM_ASM_000384 /TAXON_ID=2969 /ORGANISM="Oxyrrhis marina" /LENGTH=63 /DNA_ID=CAMNT_0051308255 /DNA_START=125 /DNA_END=312 /DNA_ORIENTATION=-
MLVGGRCAGGSRVLCPWHAGIRGFAGWPASAASSRRLPLVGGGASALLWVWAPPCRSSEPSAA